MAALVVFLLLFPVPVAHAGPGASASLAVRTADPILYFEETGFGIDDGRLAEYFQHRGRVKTFGYPTSRTFRFLGLPTQFFQRMVLQVGPDGGVRPLNLLDPGLLPYTRINGSTFPAPDERLAQGAPAANHPSYSTAIVEFVRGNAPETFDGQPVRFFSTFSTTVTAADAFPRGGDTSLLPLINLEIWGVPTSLPARDPNNGNFVYQRFQRGIMHYDAGCRCTQGLLLADYFKALITGENLPADLEEQARGSAFLRQFGVDGANGVRRPAQLPNTDLRDAFARQEAPVALTPPPTVSGSIAAAPTTGPMRARMRVEQGLWAAVDALEAAERLDPLNAIIQSDTELAFGPLPEAVHARYTRVGRGPRRAPVRQILVSNRWREADPKSLATIIAHEAKHLEDDLAGLEAETREACFQFEIRAFTVQSEVWQAFYGPNGKPRAQNELDQELNAWLAVHQRGPGALEQRIRELYAQACAEGRAH